MPFWNRAIRFFRYRHWRTEWRVVKTRSGFYKDFFSDTRPVQIVKKELYDCTQMIEIAKSLCSLLDFPVLIESILFMCMCQMRVLSAGMYIHKTFDSAFFVLEKDYNTFNLNPDEVYTVGTSDPLILYLAEENRPHTVKSLPKRLKKGSAWKQLSSLKPSLIVPLKQKTHLSGILLLGKRINPKETAFTDYECCQISTLASLSAIAINNAALVEMTTTDAMTQLKMKHFFYTVLTDKLETSAQRKMPLSLVMFDIDFFKNVNDTYGHACGDTILKDIASLIFGGIRGQDMAARYGGEEFIVMLLDTDEKAAFKVAERIRCVIEKHCFTHDNTCIHLTISAGVSVFSPEDNDVAVRTLIDQADQALYNSKRTGRNRVTVFNSSVTANVPEEHVFSPSASNSPEKTENPAIR